MSTNKTPQTIGRTRNGLIQRLFTFDSLAILFIGILVTFLYKSLFRAFYQQDEWVIAGFYIAKGIIGPFFTVPIINAIAGYGRPLALPVNYFFFGRLPFIIWPLSVFSLLLHGLNTVLLYFFVKRLRNKYEAMIAALFFAVNSTGSQAITWFAASTTTLPSTTLVLVSLNLLLSYAKSQKKSLLLLLEIVLIASFLFKEDTIIFFAVIPFLYMLIQKNGTSIIATIRRFWILIVYACFVIGARFAIFLTPASKTGAFVTQSSHMYQSLISHLFFYPIISISQYFFPPTILYKAAALFLSVEYSLPNPSLSTYLSQNIVADLLCVISSLCIVSVALWIYLTNRSSKTAVLFSLGTIILSVLPYSVLNRGASYLDSRYYYTGLIGAAVLCSIIVTSIWKWANGQKKIIALSIKALLVISTVLFFYKHSVMVKRDLLSLVMTSQERIHLLTQMKRVEPDLPDKPIFYIEGNQTAYYGVRNLPVPLQQGVGYSLMVYFYNSGKIPSQFLSDWFLWDLGSQGYKEIDPNHGYGFYTDKNVLRELFLSNKNLRKEQIVGFYYNSNTQTVTNISRDIQSYISDLPQPK